MLCYAVQSEAAIFEAFSSEAFVSQLASYLSLEERKGHDRFDAKRFYLFKVSSFALEMCAWHCRRELDFGSLGGQLFPGPMSQIWIWSFSSGQHA